MKNKFLLGLLLLSSVKIFAQWDVSASMGLDFKSMPVYKDYINMNFSTANNQISSFKSAVSFTAEGDYKISKSFALGLEYNLQLDSYNGVGGLYEISYSVHRPSLIGYYIIPGAGFQFKFGGGLGYRSVVLNERIMTDTKYTASGFGLVAKAEGNTMLADHFYALIGGNIRYDATGDVANGDQYIVNRSTGDKLNLNSISFGIYLGVTFTF